MNDRHEILTEEMAWTPCRASHLRRACWKKRGRLTHFSEPWEQCFDTKQHESLQCKRLVQCLFSSVQQCPTSHVASTWYNVRHHTDSYYMFLVNVQSRNYYEILWITNTMNYYELLWFTDIFVLRLYVFLGNLSFSWVVYCRMLPHAQLLIASEPFAPCCVASRGPPIWGKETFHICPNNFRKSSKV